MMREPHERWPDALLLLGDQIYADEVSEGALDFIRSRRDTNEPPGEQVADFEEYTRLYWDAWRYPVIRWLLSTVPTTMIFDDHDVNDDWNISEAWVRQMRTTPWWEERIIGAFMSYWVYQHLGNLSPRELEEDGLFEKVQEAENPTRILREFAYKADREIAGTRWSYHRDFGRVRLIMMDSRAGRVLKEGHRSMLDEEEWAWIVEMATGDFDHLLFGTSLPLPPWPRTPPPGSGQRGRLRRRLGPPRSQDRGVGPPTRRPGALVCLPQILHRPYKPATLRRSGRYLERRPSRLGNDPLRRRAPRLPGEDGLRRRRRNPRLPVGKLPPA